MASGEFGVVDAADGYILLARGATTPTTACPMNSLASRTLTNAAAPVGR